MDAKTQAWLDGMKATGEIDDATFATLTTVLGKAKVDEYVKGSVLRQDDYSRMSNEVKAAKDAAALAENEYKIKAQEVTQFQTTLGTWKVGADKDIIKATKAEQVAAAKYEKAVNKLKNLAVAQGLDETEVLADLDTPMNNNTNTNPGFDPNKFVSRDAFESLVKQATAQSTANEAMVSATLADINSEHVALYGKPITNTRELVTGALKAGKPLYEFAETHLKFADQRAAKVEEGVQLRIAEAVKVRETQLSSEAALNGGHVTGLGAGFRPDLVKGSLSPVLSKSGGMPLPAAIDQGRTESGASAAAAAFVAGKYKAGGA